jgi:hypothetical protein
MVSFFDVTTNVANPNRWHLTRAAGAALILVYIFCQFVGFFILCPQNDPERRRLIYGP